MVHDGRSGGTWPLGYEVFPQEVFIAQRDAIAKHFHAKEVAAPRMVSTSLVNPGR